MPMPPAEPREELVIEERWRLLVCPECGRAATVSPYYKRPICVHAWEGGSPEIWDGDDADGNDRPIEQSPNEDFRAAGPNTWAEMVPATASDQRVKELIEVVKLLLPWAEMAEDSDNMFTWSYDALKRDLASARAALEGSDE